MPPSQSQTTTLERPSESSPPPLQPRRLWPSFLVILLLAGGGVTLWRLFGPESGATAPTATAQQSPPPRPVEIATLAAGRGVQTVRLIGQVEARSSAVVRTRTAGIVQQVLVQPGDTVQAGTAIAILDDVDQQLALSLAQARLAEERSNLTELERGTRPEIIEQRHAALRSAQARETEALDNLERTKTLVEEGALSRRLLIEAQATAETARAERLEAAAALAEATAGPRQEDIEAQRAVVAASEAAVNQTRLALARTRIQATADGIVQSRSASVGDYLEASDPVVALIAGDTLDIFLELPEALSGQIAPGLPVTLSARALPEWQIQAAITAVIPATDAASRRQRIRVELDNSPVALLPGMAVQGELELAAERASFIVSRDALTRRGTRWVVFTVVDGQAQEFAVDLVADMGEQVAIYSDQLQAGQPLVVKGGDGLTDGAQVKITS